jgi:hypothetical protein
MKHFEEPLTVFVHDTSLETVRRELAVDLLLLRLVFAIVVVGRRMGSGWVSVVVQIQNPEMQRIPAPAVLDSIDDARLGLKT